MELGRAALVVCDIVVSQGADNDFVFRYGTQSGGVTSWVDLTAGYGARAQLRARPGAEVWVDLTTDLSGGSGIVLDAEGFVRVHVHHTETEGAAWNSAARARGVWDLELVKPGGEVVRLVMGAVTVSPDVTRVVS